MKYLKRFKKLCLLCKLIILGGVMVIIISSTLTPSSTKLLFLLSGFLMILFGLPVYIYFRTVIKKLKKLLQAPLLEWTFIPQEYPGYIRDLNNTKYDTLIYVFIFSLLVIGFIGFLMKSFLFFLMLFVALLLCLLPFFLYKYRKIVNAPIEIILGKEACCMNGKVFYWDAPFSRSLDSMDLEKTEFGFYNLIITYCVYDYLQMHELKSILFRTISFSWIGKGEAKRIKIPIPLGKEKEVVRIATENWKTRINIP